MMTTMDFRSPRPLKRRALEQFQNLLGRTRLPHWYGRANTLNGAVILMYHSTAQKTAAEWIDPCNRLSPECFRRHIGFLAARRRVVSFERLVRHLLENEPIPRGTVVITFDDGYLDNLEVAFPILEEFSMPASVFLPTAYIDRAENQWIDRLYACFRLRTAHHLIVDTATTPREYRIRSHQDCVNAYGDLARALLQMTYAQRTSLLDSIEQQLRPSAAAPRLTMSWDDVRRSAERYPQIEFGSHTQTHIDVTAHPQTLVNAELSASRATIEREIRRPVRYFSFPYNRVSRPAMDALERLGYQGAVADGADVRIDVGANRFALPRYEAPASLGRLALVTSGAFPEISMRLTGRI